MAVRVSSRARAGKRYGFRPKRLRLRPENFSRGLQPVSFCTGLFAHFRPGNEPAGESQRIEYRRHGQWQILRPDETSICRADVANRNDAVRAVFVIDTSASMQGAAFNSALEAAARFIDAKRAQDQVAVIALEDSSTGYRLVSDFERDPGALARRLADLDADTTTSRLYDATGAAMAMSASAGQGQPGQLANTASTSIIVFSDGKDEGSALVRSDLMNRIAALGIPVPIYSLGYNTGDAAHLLNLDALSRASFGSYTDVSDNPGRMTPIVEGLHRTMQNDYVVTFRSYIPVDGDAHNLKVGLEYPSRSGQLQYQSTSFEAISPPPVPAITEAPNA